MKIPCLFNQCTIRQRLILLNFITVGLIFTLISIYTFQLVKLEHEMVTMQQVDDLFNNILEVRRYEKNILLQLDKDSASKARQLLLELHANLEELSLQFNERSGTKLLLQITQSLDDYDEVFNRWSAIDNWVEDVSGQKDSHLIRHQGQLLMDHAAVLVRHKREEISLGFKEVLFWLTFIPALIFVCGSILFFSQVKSILHRLSSLQEATRELAAGAFSTIPTMGSPDEITSLITNFNEMVETLEQKQEELIQSKKMASIGTFSSGIAHEINNPLNNISLSTDTLIEEYDTMDPVEVKEILDDIMIQTDRASAIVRNLLDFSRAHSLDMQLVFIDFVLHKTVSLIENELRIHKIDLKKDIADMLPEISGDLQQLQQVFLNLIINAEQAIGDDGVITVRARATDNGYIRTDISDTGPGIAQENMAEIFDPFFTTKEVGKGTGLGLAIVYGIIQKHGGYIEVASKLGEGTTFSVYLPVGVQAEVEGGVQK